MAIIMTIIMVIIIVMGLQRRPRCCLHTCLLLTSTAATTYCLRTCRELNAVDSEHKKNLQNDMWRGYQLLKHVAAEDSPFHRFSTGRCGRACLRGVAPACNALRPCCCSDNHYAVAIAHAHDHDDDGSAAWRR